MNYDESNDMTSQQIWKLLDEWEWDSLTGRFQDYLIALRRERAEMLEACRMAYAYVDAIVEHAELWGRPADEDTQEIHGLLGAAIAKAKGE